MIFVIPVWVACGLALVQLARYGRRIHVVFSFRRQLLSDIHKAATLDIEAGRDWMWRYDMFEAADVDDMLGRLLLPSSRNVWSFYPDRSFVDPSAVQVVS